MIVTSILFNGNITNLGANETSKNRGIANNKKREAIYLLNELLLVFKKKQVPKQKTKNRDRVIWSQKFVTEKLNCPKKNKERKKYIT